MELVGLAPYIGAGAGHCVGTHRALYEAADGCRVASEPQRQFRHTFYCPVTRARQGQLCFRILGITLLVIVIVEWQ